jgi:hypothetical protein
LRHPDRFGGLWARCVPRMWVQRFVARHALEARRPRAVQLRARVRAASGCIGSLAAAQVLSRRHLVPIGSKVTISRFALVVALVACALGVWRFSERSGATAAGGASDILAPIADARFTVAEANLALQHQTTGSYTGAQMPGGTTLVRGDATTYCVQIGPPGTVAHVAGPGGAATAGACP